MTTAPLFETPATMPAATGTLPAVARKRITELREAGLLKPADELTAAQIEHVSAAIMRAKPYALANLNRELSDLIDRLPTEPLEGDADPFERVRAILLDLRESSAGWEPAA